jgi:DNA-binding Xre family transcriptional regulator
MPERDMAKSTYEREMERPKFKRRLLKGYRDLALSELIVAMMAEEGVSVRRLAKEIGLAPSVVQSVRSGRHSNLTLRSFVKLMAALGGELAVKKGRHYVLVKVAG